MVLRKLYIKFLPHINEFHSFCQLAYVFRSGRAQLLDPVYRSQLVSKMQVLLGLLGWSYAGNGVESMKAQLKPTGHVEFSRAGHVDSSGALYLIFFASPEVAALLRENITLASKNGFVVPTPHGVVHFEAVGMLDITDSDKFSQTLSENSTPELLSRVISTALESGQFSPEIFNAMSVYDYGWRNRIADILLSICEPYTGVFLGGPHLNGLSGRSFYEIFTPNVVAENSSLTSIDLPGCGLGDKEAATLASMKNLIHVNLAHNDVGPEGFAAFSEMLEDQDYPLTTLDLTGNPRITKEMLKKIDTALEKKRKMWERVKEKAGLHECTAEVDSYVPQRFYYCETCYWQDLCEPCLGCHAGHKIHEGGYSFIKCECGQSACIRSAAGKSAAQMRAEQEARERREADEREEHERQRREMKEARDKAIATAMAEKQCTSTIFKGDQVQVGRRCVTCSTNVCVVCARHCHEGHWLQGAIESSFTCLGSNACKPSSEPIRVFIHNPHNGNAFIYRLGDASVADHRKRISFEVRPVNGGRFPPRRGEEFYLVASDGRYLERRWNINKGDEAIVHRGATRFALGFNDIPTQTWTWSHGPSRVPYLQSEINDLPLPVNCEIGLSCGGTSANEKVPDTATRRLLTLHHSVRPQCIVSHWDPWEYVQLEPALSPEDAPGPAVPELERHRLNLLRGGYADDYVASSESDNDY